MAPRVPLVVRLDTLLDQGLPTRLYASTLARGGYGSLDELRVASDADLLRVYMFGPLRLRALRDWLAAHPRGAPAWRSTHPWWLRD